MAFCGFTSIMSSAACTVAILFWAAAVAAQEEPADIADEAETLAPLDLPQIALDSTRVASLTDAIELAGDARKPSLLEQRAKEYMRSQEWREAAADYQTAAKLQPDNSMHWMRGALLLRLAESPMHYDQFAKQMLKHFKETTNPYHAERTAKICWLATPPVEEREIAEKLADFAMARRMRPWGQYYPTTRALGHYRYEQYEEAIKAIAESDRLNAAGGNPRPDLDTINRIIAAMCLQKLDRDDEALAELERGSGELRKSTANAELLYNDGFWNDWLTAKLLHDEACQLWAEDSDRADGHEKSAEN